MNKKIKNSIYTFRGEDGLLDRDLASLLDIETKRLNEQLKRNQNLFSEKEIFVLKKDEFDVLMSQFATSSLEHGGLRKLPTFFTKSGIEKCLSLFKKESQIDVLKKIIITLDSENIDIIFPDSELKNDVYTYISKNGNVVFDVKIDNETVWITQQQMADLFESTRQNITMHLTNIFDEKELEKNSTSKDYLHVQIEGNRSINRPITHYNLDAILAVGYRISTKKGTQFRQWATHILKQHLLDGYSIKENITQKQLDNALSRIAALEANQDKWFNQLPLSNDILNNIDFINLIKASPSTKHKISNTTLIILCEGKTDIIYIKKAITLFSPNLNLDSIKFVDAEGHKNLKSVLDTYKKQDIGMKILHPSLFVFDCDVLGINNETKDNVISYIFKRKCTEENHVYQRGIENNFHNSVFLKLFDQKISSIKLIKEISNTPTGQQETLINVSFDKVTLCNALYQHGTKDDFIYFKDIVSLITELVGSPQITRS